ncbi:MAG: hypothetical protein LUG96_01240 [Tannerellaceae bacterium]|nr:hypothetical protein [Tannerellaceae bacterium]
MLLTISTATGNHIALHKEKKEVSEAIWTGEGVVGQIHADHLSGSCRPFFAFLPTVQAMYTDPWKEFLPTILQKNGFKVPVFILIHPSKEFSML